MTDDHPHPGDLDVIVVTWNSGPHLAAALDAVPSWARVLAVDNASQDDSVEVACHHGATVIELDTNVGFPAAVNKAFAEVQAPAVMLLNPDLVLGPGCVERCLEVLAQDPTVAIVGPATRTPEGRPEPPAARHDRRAWHILVESFGLVHVSRRFDRQMIHRRDRDQDVDAINGACMVIRTDVLRRLGGLDESVFMYLEDADLCRRARDLGFRVRFAASATAMHEGGASTLRGDQASQVRAYLHRVDADMEFLRRHGRRGEAGVAFIAFVLRALLGLLVSVLAPQRRPRYRAALSYAWRQRRGRIPPPPV